MRREVFISYSTADKHVADAICSVLEDHDISCWIAPRDVPPGASYGEALVDAISQSSLLVLIFSSQSNNSQQVGREIERAAARGVPIIPFRIQNVSPSKSLEFFISASHWLDALSVPLDEHLTHLVTAVRGLLDTQKDRRIGDGEQSTTMTVPRALLPEPEEPVGSRGEYRFDGEATLGKDLRDLTKCLRLEVRIADASLARTGEQILEITKPIGSLTIEERKKAYTIGRSPGNDLVLDDQMVSRHHAFIFSSEGRFTIVDGALESDGTLKRSTNGIVVDGKRQLQCALSHGTVISIGGHTITCSIDA